MNYNPPGGPWQVGTQGQAPVNIISDIGMIMIITMISELLLVTEQFEVFNLTVTNVCAEMSELLPNVNTK